MTIGIMLYTVVPRFEGLVGMFFLGVQDSYLGFLFVFAPALGALYVSRFVVNPNKASFNKSSKVTKYISV